MAKLFFEQSSTSELTEVARNIILIESPVSLERVESELLRLAGISKINAKHKERCLYLIRSTRLPFTVQNLNYDVSYVDISEIKAADWKEFENNRTDDDKVFIWSDKKDIPYLSDIYRIPPALDKPRKACDITIQEAARAVIDVAESQCGLPRESLITETAKALGFTRTASNTDCYKLCKLAVDYAFSKDALVVDSKGFIMPSDANI